MLGNGVNDNVPGVQIAPRPSPSKGSGDGFQNSSFIQLVRRMRVRSLTTD